MAQLRNARAAVPSGRQNGRNQLAALTILGMTGEQPLSLPGVLCTAVPKKATVLVGLKGRSSTGIARGALKESVLLHFNENRLAAIGW